jgi:hypothetical protein
MSRSHRTATERDVVSPAGRQHDVWRNGPCVAVGFCTPFAYCQAWPGDSDTGRGGSSSATQPRPRWASHRAATARPRSAPPRGRAPGPRPPPGRRTRRRPAVFAYCQAWPEDSDTGRARRRRAVGWDTSATRAQLASTEGKFIAPFPPSGRWVRTPCGCVSGSGGSGGYPAERARPDHRGIRRQRARRRAAGDRRDPPATDRLCAIATAPHGTSRGCSRRGVVTRYDASLRTTSSEYASAQRPSGPAASGKPADHNGQQALVPRRGGPDLSRTPGCLGRVPPDRTAGTAA